MDGRCLFQDYGEGEDGEDMEGDGEGEDEHEETEKEKEGFESLAPEDGPEDEGEELKEDEQQPQVQQYDTLLCFFLPVALFVLEGQHHLPGMPCLWPLLSPPPPPLPAFFVLLPSFFVRSFRSCATALFCTFLLLFLLR